MGGQTLAVYKYLGFAIFGCFVPVLGRARAFLSLDRRSHFISRFCGWDVILFSSIDGHDMSVVHRLRESSGNEIAHITLSIEKCGSEPYDGWCSVFAGTITVCCRIENISLRQQYRIDYLCKHPFT